MQRRPTGNFSKKNEESFDVFTSKIFFFDSKQAKLIVFLSKDILPKINVLYENTNTLTRAKAYTLTYLLLSTYYESLYTLSDTKSVIIDDFCFQLNRSFDSLFSTSRLFQAIDRDFRRKSADPDENDLLNESLNRLTTLISSLLGRTLGSNISIDIEKRKQN